MKNIRHISGRTLKISGLVLAVALISCTGVQAYDNCLSLTVALGNAIESSVPLELIFKFVSAVLGMSPVICILNYASSKTSIFKK